jgi:hypothetical protein
MKNDILKFGIACLLLISWTNDPVLAQVADVGLNAEYQPNTFPKYNQTPVSGTEANGTFLVILTKTGETLPANHFSIVISLAPGAPYTGAPFAVPEGFTLEVFSNISLILRQTQDYPGSGLPARKRIEIPVQALRAVSSTGPSNWLVEIQEEDDYADPIPSNNTVSGRVAVADVSLPVTLISFNVKKEGPTANLSWMTTEETNSDRFEIQRSSNAKNWNAIGEIAAAGESKAQVTYRFQDAYPAAGLNYYRLRMIDKDETFAFSSVRTIEFPKTNIRIYPNPVSDELTIRTDQGGLAKVRLFDQKGVAVYDSGAKVSDTINVRNLASGIYIVRMEHLDGTINTQNVLVVR